MSCEMNDRPAELSKIRVARPHRHLLTSDLVLYPQCDQKPVQFLKDRCDMVEFTGSSDHPCRSVLNSLELLNDVISDANQ